MATTRLADSIIACLSSASSEYGVVNPRPKDSPSQLMNNTSTLMLRTASTVEASTIANVFVLTPPPSTVNLVTPRRTRVAPIISELVITWTSRSPGNTSAKR